MSLGVKLASFKASLVTLKAHSRWCTAVSRGEKPSPGGVIKVSLTLAKISTWSFSWRMIPTPSLLADPSKPIATTIVKKKR